MYEDEEEERWSNVRRNKRSADGLQHVILPPNKVQNISDVTTSNRFSPLSNATEKEEELAKKIPPIYIKNVALNEYKGLVNEISKVVGNEFECQATNNNSITIFPNTSDAYRSIANILNNLNCQFHSYQFPKDKAYRVVIRHLHPSTDAGEIKLALEEKSFKVRTVTNVLQSGTRVPLPLFFVDLEPDINNSKIFELRVLLHTRIQVEEPKKKNDILQCKRCLQLGHSRSYCHHPVRCARCGNSHETTACNIAPTESRICVLCNGNHSSTYKGCQVYKELRNKRNFTDKRTFNNLSSNVRRTAPVSAPASTQVGINSARTTHVSTPVHTPTYTHTSQPQQSLPTHTEIKTKTRDPRLSSPLYAQVAAGNRRNQLNFPNTSLSDSSQYLAPTITHDSFEKLSLSLNSFFNRFQELINPLISALNLLINKLLSN